MTANWRSNVYDTALSFTQLWVILDTLNQQYIERLTQAYPLTAFKTAIRICLRGNGAGARASSYE